MRRPVWRLLICTAFFLLVLSSSALAESLSSSEELPLSGFSSEDAAGAFVDQALNTQTRATRLFARNTAGSRLTGINRTVYERLSEDFRLVAGALAEKNAEGGIPTVFTYPVSELLEKTSYTLDELGLDTFLAPDGKTLSPEARAALDAAMGRDFQLVIQSVLADYPYEIYWYDKTQKVVISSPRYSLSENRTRITVGGSYTFRFPVMQEYALSETASEDPVYVYDPSHTELVESAILNAADIVEKYRDATDEEKLRGYMEAICNATDYNSEAAANQSFGNPWQLIWVFDGDSQTRVV
ncbi:MAG: hypothetical protein J6B53_13020, partial [Clostridia bacterium]|nr:hypothetical protein [Clostridia bacterium]